MKERNKRLVQAKENLPWVLWMGTLGGGLLVIAMSFLIYMEKGLPQLLTTMGLASLIGMMIFIMVLFSRPFAGPIALTLAPFQSTLKVLDDVNRGN